MPSRAGGATGRLPQPLRLNKGWQHNIALMLQALQRRRAPTWAPTGSKPDFASRQPSFERLCKRLESTALMMQVLLQQ